METTTSSVLTSACVRRRQSMPSVYIHPFIAGGCIRLRKPKQKCLSHRFMLRIPLFVFEAQYAFPELQKPPVGDLKHFPIC